MRTTSRILGRASIPALVMLSLPLLATAQSPPPFYVTHPPLFTVPGAAYPYFDGPLAGDFTGDGLPDALFMFSPPTTLAVLSKTAAGAIQVSASQIPGADEDVLAGAADVDLDGRLDVVAFKGVCYAQICTTGTARVYLNSATSGFVAGPSLGGLPLAGFNGVALADLDGDGAQELVVLGQSWGLIPPTLQVWTINPLTLSFTLRFTHVFANQMASMTVADLNGDALQDIAVGEATAGHVGVFFQGPGMTFGGLVQVALPAYPGLACATCAAQPRQLGAADVDHDGFNDLVAFGLWSHPSNLAGARWLLRGPFGSNPAIVGGGLTSYPAAHRLVFGNIDADDQQSLEVISDLVMYRLPVTANGQFPLGGLSFVEYGSLVEHCHVAIDLDADGDLDLLGAYRNALGGPASVDIRFLENPTLQAAGCVNPQTGLPSIGAGTATLGNLAFAITLSGAQPGVAAALGLSAASVFSSAGPCTVGLDLSQLILPSGALGLATTDSTGHASIPLPISIFANVLNTPFYAQWISQDPNGPLGAGGSTWTITQLRRIHAF